MIEVRGLKALSILFAALLIVPASSHAESSLGRVSGEQLASAVGHYARARSLLIEAIREFDRGHKIADPDALMDSKRWRATLLDRAKELERVLDPQPKASRSGIKFNADKRLLNEAKD
ncbi:MAG: hypothetical protein J5J00_16615 [Deltaproteobacteria bacterium]|nr:hypothetical protein [Deltaproteobacteria bacterium]